MVNNWVIDIGSIEYINIKKHYLFKCYFYDDILSGEIRRALMLFNNILLRIRRVLTPYTLCAVSNITHHSELVNSPYSAGFFKYYNSPLSLDSFTNQLKLHF